MGQVPERGIGPEKGWFAQRIRSRRPLVALGAYDALSARLVGRAGAEACYLGGYATLASAHAMPDLGIAGMAEMLDMYRRIVPAAGVPVIVDADTGYGGLLNVRRTVHALSALHVAAVQIEDQANPKQCGHLADKSVVGVAEACRRITVAVAEAGVEGPAIIARTDALEAEGLNRTVDRANRYLGAGAVAAFVDAPTTRREIELIPTLIDGPVVYNAARTGRGPLLSSGELFGLGYAMVFHPIELMLAVYAEMSAVLRGFMETGEFQHVNLPPFDDVNDFLGVHESLRWERAQAASRSIPVLPAHPPSLVPASTEESISASQAAEPPAVKLKEAEK
ncbi:isocitrate lyase/PEP mutase family protein [Streptomyces sp. NPDC001177]